MTLIAHLSDCHIPPLPRVKLKQLLSKRVSGYVNWHLKRKYIHSKDVLDLLCEDMRSYGPDHIALTGDLVNLGLPDEFTNALNWLDSLGTEEQVSVVPGNHDSYVRMPVNKGFYEWRKFMESHPKEVLFESKSSFPYVKYIAENIVLIGLSSSIPTAVSMATGRLGEEQLAAFQKVLQKLSNKNIFKIVLIHHPPLLRQTSRRRCLLDGGDLESIFEQESADLVLHGHNHTNTINRIKTKGDVLPIVGVASASSQTDEKGDFASYNLINVTFDGQEWNYEMTMRGLNKAGFVKQLAKYSKQDLIQSA